MESGYQQEPVADGGVRFTVTPAPAPRAVGVALTLAGLLGVGLTGLPMAGSGPGAIALRLAIAAPASWWVYRSVERWRTRRGERSRAPGGTFVVSASGIETGGTLLRRERLRGLIVINAVSGADEPTFVETGSIYLDPPMGSRDPGAGRAREPGSRDPAAGRARAAVSYLLCAAERDRATTLAGGMTALTAHGLLTDVSRILSLG